MPEQSPDTFTIDLTQCRNNWDTPTKIKRGIWQFLVKPLYLLIPYGLSDLRVGILRLFGARIGTHCNIQKRVDILIPWNLELGNHVALGHDTCILNFAEVSIGPMSVVSQYSHLCTGTHNPSDPHFKLVFSPIVIEAESWIASGAFVGPGVHIGRGCVIGAQSVVTKDQPAWSICAGNPCKKLKDRTMKPE